MYKAHPICSLPDGKTKIWRFLDFTKFYSLLEKSKLHFARADQLDDRFEGSIPKSMHQLRFKPAYEQYKGILPEKSLVAFQNSPSLLKMIRQMSYICSFHISEEESAALWKIYVKSNEGVAIQTTVEKLIISFNSNNAYDVYLSTVNYIDYSRETIPLERNTLYPLLHKRKSFEYEKNCVLLFSFQKISLWVILNQENSRN